MPRTDLNKRCTKSQKSRRNDFTEEDADEPAKGENHEAPRIDTGSLFQELSGKCRRCDPLLGLKNKGWSWQLAGKRSA